MTNLSLQRAPTENDVCTIGALQVPRDDGSTHHFVTLELPDKNNEHNVSRILAGTYRYHVRPAHETRHGYDVVELENVPGRDHVQIHIGNYPRDTDGCILLGLSVSESKTSIDNSAAAYKEFMKLVGTESGSITISDPPKSVLPW